MVYQYDHTTLRDPDCPVFPENFSRLCKNQNAVRYVFIQACPTHSVTSLRHAFSPNFQTANARTILAPIHSHATRPAYANALDLVAQTLNALA